MLAAARETRGFVEGLNRETFLADRRTQQAVVMNLLIIGEAAAKIMDADPAVVRAYPEIPWRYGECETGWRTATSRRTM
jgi:uncharacterized protein with HEPN domain